MARCHACGTEYDNAGDLLLARNRDDRWVTLCRACRDKGVDPDGLDPVPAAGAGPAPPEDVDPFDAARRLFALWRGQRQLDALRPNTRVHERHAADIAIRFHLARDDVYHNATVVDLSSGGVQFVTAHPVEKAQMIHFDHQMPLPSVLLDLFQSAAEVRRVLPTADGRWRVGVRFVQRQAAKGANRRRHRRYGTRMLLLYRRERSDIVALAEVRDLSKGGMMLRVHERLDVGETLEVRVRGDTGSFAKGDLVGSVRVLRAIERPDHGEIGCVFVETRIEPRRTPKRSGSTSVALAVPPAP